MQSTARALTFLFTFLLGMGTMYVYDTTVAEPNHTQLERVTIMRPVANETIPNQVTKLPEITPAVSAQPANHLPPPTLSETSTTTAVTSELLDVRRETGTVEFVYDGDTVRLADKRKIRLTGIDSSEMNYGKGEPQCYAREAKKQLEALVGKKQITLVADKEDKDRFGRALRYMYVTTPAGELFVNNALVQSGAATPKRYPPNTLHALQFEDSMQKAQAAKLGLWAACK
jgi:endonuclease YncB( thermonuclease family)